MTRDADSQLQEFLDGRLSTADRAAFEARLKDDAELARRVHEYREMRQALREDGPQLSAGFYTRARARFEESSPAARPAWTRLVSWEAAGLAAAALLMVAVFLPDFVERRLPEPVAAPQESVDVRALPAPSVRQQPPGRRDSNETPAEDRLEAPQRQRKQVAATPEKKESRKREDASLGDRDAPTAEVERYEEAPRLAAPAAPAPIAGEKARVADVVEELRAEPGIDQPRSVARRSVAEPMAKSAPAQESASRAAADLEVESNPAPFGDRLEAEGLGQASKSDEYAPDVRMLRGIVLPAGAVEPGGLRTIETEAEWNAWVRGPASAVFASADYDAVQRTVLIGARERAFDCARIRTRVSAAAYLLILESSNDALPRTGCAVFLPRDARSVDLEERP